MLEICKKRSLNSELADISHLHERVKKSVILVLKKTQEGLITDAFYGCEKVKKIFCFCDLKDSAYTAVKGMQNSK